MTLDDQDLTAAIRSALDTLVPPKANEDTKGRDVLARSVGHAVVTKLQDAFDGGALTVTDGDGTAMNVSFDATVEALE